jgi:two-component system sensor histidine kinase VicK
MKNVFESEHDIKQLNENLRNTLKKGLKILKTDIDKISDDNLKKEFLKAEQEIDSVNIALKKINQLIILNQYPANMWKKIDLLGPLSNSIETMKHRADVKNIKINFEDKSMNKRTVYGEDIIFEEFIFDNIISNAIKFSPRDSQLDITLDRRKSYFYVTFRDYGIGMDEEFVHRIHYVTERFFHPDVEGKIGSGMSYPIINRVMTKLNGALRVESFTQDTASEKRGTRVTLRFNAF